MGVSVVVPWRPGCEHREAAWRWVRARYESAHPDWEIVRGHHIDVDWCKARAVADGIDAASGEILIVADADVWCHGVAEAVALVAHGAPWVIPHRKVHRLDATATRAVLDGGPLGGKLTERAYGGRAGGGIVVLSRSTWEAAPLDPRFLGWGQEDESWALALCALFGKPIRLEHDLWHLWHPPQARRSRQVGSIEGRRLRDRYWRARNNPKAIAALLDEFREVRHGSR